MHNSFLSFFKSCHPVLVICISFIIYKSIILKILGNKDIELFHLTTIFKLNKKERFY